MSILNDVPPTMFHALFGAAKAAAGSGAIGAAGILLRDDGRPEQAAQLEAVGDAAMAVIDSVMGFNSNDAILAGEPVMAPLPPPPDDLNPGIRRTVTLLRRWGFDTCDSGDGVTHDHACDQPMPYVHIRVDRVHQLAMEAQRLAGLLQRHDITTCPMDEAGTAKAIEASYSPAHGFATITLWNVSDRDLPPF